MLPDNINMTREGRRVFAFLEKKPEASISETEKGADVSYGTAVKWRKLWRSSGGSGQEAPPPTVRREVRSQDPEEVFGRANLDDQDAGSEPPGGPSKLDTPQQEESDHPNEQADEDEDEQPSGGRMVVF